MEAAVSASISTPVCPDTFASLVTRTPGRLSSASRSTLIFMRDSGWQSGISSCVFFAAMMPAMRATANTSPFLAWPERQSASVSGRMTTLPSAIATRSVTALAETSTIRASPVSERCVRSGMTRRRSHRPRGAQRLALQQHARRRGHVLFAHQRFADEEGEDAAALEPQAIVMAKDAALADDNAVLRNALR